MIPNHNERNELRERVRLLQSFKNNVYKELWKYMDEGEPGELTDESALYLLKSWLEERQSLKKKA